PLPLPGPRRRARGPAPLGAATGAKVPDVLRYPAPSPWRNDVEEAQGRRARRDRHGRSAVRVAAREPPLVRGDGRRRERELRREEVRRGGAGALGDEDGGP